jgi:ribose 1,5-bisphosphokinase PhnN
MDEFLEKLDWSLNKIEETVGNRKRIKKILVSPKYCKILSNHTEYALGWCKFSLIYSIPIEVDYKLKENYKIIYE